MRDNIFILLLILADIFLITLNLQLSGKFSIDKTINILDLFSLLTTIVIALFVPFIIKTTIDDKRGIKMLLIEEVNGLILLAKKNHLLIANLHSGKTSIEGHHRDEALNTFHDMELKIDSLNEQLMISYPSKINIGKTISDDKTKYKEFITGGVFMISSYKEIDYGFYRAETNAFAQFEKSLIKHIHEIHRF